MKTRSRPAVSGPPALNSRVQPISTIRKQPTIGQIKRLLLAALRVWELKNGYHPRFE